MRSNEMLWDLLLRIPKGKVTTYKELAVACNMKSYRLVGQILKRNTNSKYPCYKVVMSDGNVGGYFGSNIKNINKKVELLKNDGIEVKNGKIDLKKYLFCFGAR